MIGFGFGDDRAAFRPWTSVVQAIKFVRGGGYEHQLPDLSRTYAKP
jgi:hypothetical protein